MNFNDIVKIINNDYTVNFIASAITPLHMVGIQATLSKMVENGVNPKGYILVRPHGKTGRLDLAKQYNLTGLNIQCVDFDMKISNGKIPFIKSHYLATEALKKQTTHKRVIYVLWTKIEYDWLYILNSFSSDIKIVFIIIDDGAGSYCNRFKSEYSIELERTGNKRKILSGIKIFLVTLYENKLNKIAKRTNCLIDNRIINEHITEYYKLAFKNSNVDTGEEESAKLASAVLLNTQCFENEKWQDEIYEDIINQLKKYNKSIIVKTHPREKKTNKYELLDVGVLNCKCTQESLLAQIDTKPLCIISIYSSTLLNAKFLFGIPAISVAKIALNKKIDKHTKNIMKDYINTYSDKILFPKSVEELIHILDEIEGGK